MSKWWVWALGGSVVLFGGLLIGALYYDDYTMTHRGWSDIDEDAVENARTYEAAPVLWLGEEFDVEDDGEPERLSSFRVRDSAASGLPERISLSYGRCKFPKYEGGCSLPLSMWMEFGCAPSAEIGTLRGATIENHADYLVLVTPGLTITIFSHGDERRVAEALHGANALAAHITTDSDLSDVVTGACRRS